MIKTLLLWPALVLFAANAVFSQTSGLLPLTGIRYFSEGIYARYAEVTIDGLTLINNRIPLNKEVIIKLQGPTGFTADAAKKIYPAVEVSYLNLRRQLLSTIPNGMKELEKSGMAFAGSKELVIKLTLPSQLLKTETAAVILLRYYDLKSKKQLRLEFPVSIAPTTDAASLSRFTSTIKTGEQAIGLANAVGVDKALVTVDTSIRVAPKNAYLSIEIPVITGTSMTEVLGGTYSFWVFDNGMNEIKATDKLLKKVGGAMEDNLVNLTVKIPFRLKTDLKKNYSIRFRWESQDKKKVIDIVATR